MYSEEMKKAVSEMMYAFGDTEGPLEASVECMCGLLLGFLDEVLLEAGKIAQYKGKFDAECLLFVCRNDLLVYKAAKTQLESHKALKDEVNKEV